MTSGQALEATIDKILRGAEEEVLANVESARKESRGAIDGAVPELEAEYDKIVSDGRKEADKIEKQIVGSSDLEARNRQLVALEEAVDGVFAKALERIAGAERDADYAALVRSMVEESARMLGTTEIVISTNSRDRGLVESVLPQFHGAEISADEAECLGGVVARSKDGTMKFDNTLDARIERLKPLIRKEIAGKFGVGE